MSNKLHPQTISVVQTRLAPLGLSVQVGDVFEADLTNRDFSGILFQYPDTEGSVKDFTKLSETAHDHGVSLNYITHFKNFFSFCLFNFRLLYAVLRIY